MVANKTKTIKLIHDIARYIESDSFNEVSYGVYDERCGCLLFMAYYEKYFKSIKEPSNIEKYLDTVLADFNEDTYYPSFSHGISGVLYLLKFLNKHKFICVNVEDAEHHYMCYLRNSLNSFLKDGNYDFLHGALGIIYYFLSLESYRKDNVFFNGVIDNFLAYSINNNDHIIYWEDKFNGLSSNVSLAHGMSSIVLILSYMYKMNINKDQLIEPITKAINFILSQKNHTNEKSCYPNINQEDNFTEPRLAWCYGDLGIGIALYQVGCILERQDLIDESISIFLSAEKRRELIGNRVFDACFCHGCAGISHMYKRMYFNTHIKSFQDTSNYWLSKIIEFSEFSNGLVRFKTYSEGGLILSDKSLLDGISGIGMVLMSSLLNERGSSWDSLFLLNPD